MKLHIYNYVTFNTLLRVLIRIKFIYVWQDGSKAKGIETNQFLEQKLEYIHHNPVTGMIVDRAEDYVFSSARDYAGEKGMLAIEFV